MFTNIQTLINANKSVTGSTLNLQDKILALNTTTDDTKKYNDQKDFRKQIIEYTEQKNKYANMLLGVYAFLNISALAAIFHISKGS